MWGGITSEIAIGAGFLLICAACALCIAANLIVRHRFERPTEDEAHELTNGGRLPFGHRAGRASPRAAARLGHPATIPDAITTSKGKTDGF